MMTMMQLTPERFRDSIGSQISTALEESGQPNKLGKTRYGHEVILNKDGEKFYIHISRFTKSYLDRHQYWKKREIENAKEKTTNGFPVYIHRIEDIMANKARRIGKLEQEGYLRDQQNDEWLAFLEMDFTKLGSVDLKIKLESTLKERLQLVHIGRDNFKENLGLVNQYKLKKDLYDIAILARAVIEGGESFDKQYLSNAIMTVPNIK